MASFPGPILPGNPNRGSGEVRNSTPSQQPENNLLDQESGWKSFTNKFRSYITIHKRSGISVALFVLVLIFLVFTKVHLDSTGDSDMDSETATNFGQNFEKLVIPEREPPFFELTTQEERRFGILPQETFVLKTRMPVDEQIIRDNLTTSREVSIRQIGIQEFHLTPTTLLSLDEPIVIRLSVKDKEIGGNTLDRDYSWSFQSQGKFRVVSTIPGNEKTEVPLDTGIEFIFSQDEFADPSGYVSIDPAVPFETKIVDETLAIIPQENLRPETVYTVTLKRGLNVLNRNDRINEDYVFSFQTREPVVAQRPEPRLYLRDNFVQSSPREPLGVKVDTSNWSNSTIVEAIVYRFGSAGDFYRSRIEYDDVTSGWGVYYPDKHDFSTGLNEFARAQVTVQEREQVKFIQLPQAFDPGYYLVEFQVDGKLISDQVWYQSSELAGYISLGKEQTVVWVNNLSTAAPSISTTVRSLTTGETWAVNDQGVVQFTTSQAYFDEKTHYFELTDPAGNSLILPLYRQQDSNGPANRSSADYWSYFYNEKSFYASDDTVHYWGVIKNRDTGSIPDARVELTNPSNEIVYQSPIFPKSDGSFIGEIGLEEAPDGWYSLRLMAGETEVKRLSFSVKEYTKPDMKIEISSDKKAVFVDEEVEFTTSTSFFDGTPGANIELNIHESSNAKETKVQTDSSGQVVYAYKPIEFSQSRNYPHYESVHANPALSQESIVEGYANVMVYGPRLMTTIEREQEGNNASVRAIVNRVDLSGINKGDTDDPRGETVSGQEVRVVVTENWTERIEDGTYYNFIEKITLPRYRYNRKSEQVADETLTTNTFGEIVYDFDMKSDRSYEVQIIAVDDRGRAATNKLYFYSSHWSNTYYQTGQDTSIYLDLGGGKETNIFSPGEVVQVKLSEGNEDYAAGESDRFLFTTAKKGEQGILTTTEPSFSFLFDFSHVPNTYIGAVIFNGRNYIKAKSVCRAGWECRGSHFQYWYGYNNFDGMQILYDTEDSQLDVEILPSKSKYEPGEQASVEVRVTAAGQPVSNTNVNLAMIDEALAAIGGARTPDILDKLYMSVPHQIYYVYTSHNPLFAEVPGAEMGGGGGDRDLFKDTAFFGQSATNESGIAVFTFELPDNITTWLTYAQGVTSDLQAGQSETRIVVTKDFFVISKFPATYLVGDSAFVSMNSFGTSLTQSDTVDFSVIFSEGDQEISALTRIGSPFTEISFLFPTLASGQYGVTSRGSVGDRTDGIVLPVNLLETRMRQEFSTRHIVEGTGRVDDLIPGDYLDEEPVVLIVSDKGKGLFFSTLQHYCGGFGSNRLERRISSKRSDELLRESFDYDGCIASDAELNVFQNTDGGLAQVEWGGSNLETSVWAAIVAGDEFDNEKLREYFTREFDNAQGSKVRKIQAAWGLSLLGESKLKDLQGMISQAVSFEEKANLALALAYLGDTEIARNLFLDILADYAYTLRPYIRIDSELDRGNTPEAFVVDTSLSLLLGELVGSEYNEGLYSYIADFRSDLENHIIDLSEIEYIERQVGLLPDSNTLYSLTTAGGTVSEELDRGRSKVYDLLPQDVAAFSFVLGDGKAELLAEYLIGPNELSTKRRDSRLSITRTMEKAKKDSGGTIRSGDLVKITLNLTMDTQTSPKGGYTVKDILPSGLSHISNPGVFGFQDTSRPRNVSDKTVTFNVYNSTYYFKDGTHTIVYYARAVSPGIYKSEPAVFQSQRELTVFALTGEDRINIE